MHPIEWEFVKSWREVKFASAFGATAMWNDADLKIYLLTDVIGVRYNQTFNENEVKLSVDMHWAPTSFVVVDILQEPL